jgi:cyclopropane fatty-acyl-phospholipid synthase-like methyltransferase
MPEQPNPVIDHVGEYYDDIGDLVEIVGGNLHVGYWESDADDTPFLQAMNRLTGMMEERLALRRGQRLLDVGCGVGEPAVRMAQRHDVSVTGITVSRWQVQDAAKRVVSAGLRGRVSIEWADACSLPYRDETFDAAIAFDSLPNAEDKARWLSEIFRVLRPGGRFVFSEYPRLAELTPEEREILKGNAIFDPPAALTEVVRTAEAAGFEVLEGLDCGDRVRRTYVEFFDKLAGQRAELAAVYGGERVDALERGIGAVFGLCREKVGYLILTCRKPAG